MTESFAPTRRRLLKSGLAATLAIPAAGFAQSRQIVVSDPGGPYAVAYRKAFYDPFEKATGIRVISVAREAQPVAQFTAMVQTKNYIWDVTTLSISSDVPILRARGLLEPIGLTRAEYPDIMPEALLDNWLGVDVVSTTLAYRRDKFGANGPKSWADFWDVKKFPGRRSLRRNAIDTLEPALLADGVPLDQLYPLDVDRAFRSLDKIKPHISAWWTSGAQSMQLLQSGEVDMIAIWNGRSQAAIDGGAPVNIVWNQGLYNIEGWGIPLGNPKADMAKQFVRFCTDAKQQSLITTDLAYGPTNAKSYQYISPERTPFLPTAAANIKDMRLADPEWWNLNREKVSERFNTWLLS